MDEGGAAGIIRGQHGHLNGRAQLINIAEGPRLPRQLQRPGLVIKQRAQRGDEFLAGGAIELLQAHALADGPRHLRSLLAPSVEEQKVEHDGGNRADGHARRDEGLRPLREGGGDIRLEGHQHGQPQRGGDDDGVAAIGKIGLGDGL